MNSRLRVFILSFTLLLACGNLGMLAQQHPSAPAPAAQHGAQAVTNPDTAADRELSTESKEAGGEEEENAQFKHSKSVVAVSRMLGVSAETGYWIFICINFAIVAGFIYWMSRKNLVAAFRNRTAVIQKGIEDARKASTEANARLEDIQGRLEKLDAQVAEIRAAAEADFTSEEQRIKQSAEEDARRVVEAAEAEISAAAKSARRELKSYAANLAVELARKNMKVDSQTDAALVQSFASQLGKDGR